MNRFFLVLVSYISVTFFSPFVYAQTTIGRDQIEDVFLEKSGGAIYGDVVAATSAIRAGMMVLTNGSGLFYLQQDDTRAAIRSDIDLFLDPTNNGTSGAIIICATRLGFPEFLGDKITFYSHSYKLGVSPFTLDFTSDKDFRFHSDTVPDLMIIEGDQGDVVSRQDLRSGRDLIAGYQIKFQNNTVGDKILLYSPQYKMGVSSGAFDFYSDQNFKWHSDTVADAMTLDADSGVLSIKGPLQLPVYTSFPDGVVGYMIYYDHSTDDAQDGVYVYTDDGWKKL